MKVGMFMMSDFLETVVIAGMVTALFLGGWQVPFLLARRLPLPGWRHLDAAAPAWSWRCRWGAFVVKVCVMIFILMLVRWTLPRFRYDQAMRLGWLGLFPLSILNIVVTGAVLLLVGGRPREARPALLPAGGGAGGRCSPPATSSATWASTSPTRSAAGRARGAVTIQYPEERRPYSPRLRTLHRLVRREDGSPRCVACMMCETVCPAHCIYIVADEHPNPEIEKMPAALRHRPRQVRLLRLLRGGVPGGRHPHGHRHPRVLVLQPGRHDLHEGDAARAGADRRRRAADARRCRSRRTGRSDGRWSSSSSSRWSRWAPPSASSLRRNPIHGALFLVVNLGAHRGLLPDAGRRVPGRGPGDRLRGRHHGAVRLRDHGADPRQGRDGTRPAPRAAPVRAAGRRPCCSCCSGLVFVRAGRRRRPGPWRPPAASKSIGRLLFTDYLFPFELTSVLLLAAMVGVLLLARRRTSMVPESYYLALSASCSPSASSASSCAATRSSSSCRSS